MSLAPQAHCSSEAGDSSSYYYDAEDRLHWLRHYQLAEIEEAYGVRKGECSGECSGELYQKRSVNQ